MNEQLQDNWTSVKNKRRQLHGASPSSATIPTNNKYQRINDEDDMDDNDDFTDANSIIHDMNNTDDGYILVSNTRKAAVIISGDGLNSLNFNTLCQSLCELVGSLPDNPRFSRNGDMIIEATNATQQVALLKLTSILDIQVTTRLSKDNKPKVKIEKVNPGITTEAILQSLLPIGVTDVERIMRHPYNDDIEIPTSTVILTFDRQEVPAQVKLGMSYHATIIMNDQPKQCFNCYRFHHLQYTCKNTSQTCRYCAQRGHNHKDCTATTRKCVNCDGQHAATYNACPARRDIIKKQRKQNMRSVQRESYPAIPVVRTNNDAVTNRDTARPPPNVVGGVKMSQRRTFAQAARGDTNVTCNVNHSHGNNNNNNNNAAYQSNAPDYTMMMETFKKMQETMERNTAQTMAFLNSILDILRIIMAKTQFEHPLPQLPVLSTTVASNEHEQQRNYNQQQTHGTQQHPIATNAQSGQQQSTPMPPATAPPQMQHHTQNASSSLPLPHVVIPNEPYYSPPIYHHNTGAMGMPSNSQVRPAGRGRGSPLIISAQNTVSFSNNHGAI